MEIDKLLVLVGLVAAPLLAALTLWYSGVAVWHAKVAERCGRWLAVAGAFGVVSIAFITASFCALYAARVNHGWLVGPTFTDTKGEGVLLFVVSYSVMWIVAFWAGNRFIKRPEPQQTDGPDESGAKVQPGEPDPNPAPPSVRDYGQPVVETKV